MHNANRKTKVYFNDPNDGISSGFYEVESYEGDVFYLTNEHSSQVEAFRHELLFWPLNP